LPTSSHKAKEGGRGREREREREREGGGGLIKAVKMGFGSG